MAISQTFLNTAKPGLDGTLRDTCIACGRGTDTAVALRGVAEFHMAALSHLGFNEQEVIGMFELLHGCPEGMVPTGVYTQGYRVCVPCAGKSHMPKPAVLTGKGLTVYTVPSAMDDDFTEAA